MKFIRALMGRNRNESGARRGGAGSLDQSYQDKIGNLTEEQKRLHRRATDPEVGVSDVLTNVNAKVSHPPAAPAARRGDASPAPAAQAKPAVNIWDMEEGPSTELPAPPPTPPAAAAASAAAARSPARARRTKTRLIGFDKSDGDVVDIFNDTPKPVVAKRAKFPVGWLVVAEGDGRGECFTLMSGMSQIGRGEDQAVQLDFGDTSISRSNHAAIVYDAETKEFYLGHGGKSNIVRLNNKPVISNETLTSGDVIKIGETTLRFVALCDKTFSWSDGADGEDEDVAIA